MPASTFAGVIQSGPANKTGLTVSAGTLTLQAVNTYTGATNVNAGQLLLSNAAANNIANSPTITVASGATLDATGLGGGAGLTLAAAQTLSGGGVVNGPLTDVAGSTIVPGSPTAVGTLTTGNLSLAGNSNLTFLLTGAGSQISVNGSLTLPASGLNLTIPSAGSGTYELFSATGGISGFTASTFSVISPPPGLSFTFSNPAGQIDVFVSGALAWTGQTGGNGSADSGWNGTSTNWYNGASTVSYVDGNIVGFGDTNPATGSPISNSTVTINGTNVAPSSRDLQ